MRTPTHCIAVDLRTQLELGVPLQEAFQLSWSFYALQGKELGFNDAEDLLNLAKALPTNELFQLILDYKVDLACGQIQAIYNHEPKLLKGQFHLVPEGLFALSSNRGNISELPPYDAIGTQEEIYTALVDFIAEELVQPNSDKTSPLKRIEHAASRVAEHLTRHLNYIPKSALAKLGTVVTNTSFKGNFQSNFELSVGEFIVHEDLILEKLLPKQFIVNCLEKLYPGVTRRDNKWLADWKKERFTVVTKKVLEAYEVIPTDPTKWEECPFEFLALFTDSIVEANNVETTKKLFRKLLPEYVSVNKISTALPNDVLRDICMSRAYKTFNNNIAPTTYTIPALYTLLTPEDRALFIEEIKEHATPDDEYLPLPYSLSFFLDAPLAPAWSAVSLGNLAVPIAAAWNYVDRDYQAYVAPLFKLPAHPILKLLQEESFSPAQIKALKVKTAVGHLSNAIKQDALPAFKEFLTDLPNVSAQEIELFFEKHNFAGVSEPNGSKLRQYILAYDGSNETLLSVKHSWTSKPKPNNSFSWTLDS